MMRADRVPASARTCLALVTSERKGLLGARTRLQRLTSGFSRGLVLVDQAAKDRPPPDPAADRLEDMRVRARGT
jgi:hypothetical protein